MDAFRDWGLMFGRKDGNEADDERLTVQYYDSLSHLSAAGFKALTNELRETCTYFPSIKECLDAVKRDSYSNPFYSKTGPLFQKPRPLGVDDIGSDAWWRAALYDAKQLQLQQQAVDERRHQLEGPTNAPE